MSKPKQTKLYKLLTAMFKFNNIAQVQNEYHDIQQQVACLHHAILTDVSHHKALSTELWYTLPELLKALEFEVSKKNLPLIEIEFVNTLRGFNSRPAHAEEYVRTIRTIKNKKVVLFKIRNNKKLIKQRAEDFKAMEDVLAKTQPDHTGEEELANNMADDILRNVLTQHDIVGLRYEKAYPVGQLFDMVCDSGLSGILNGYGVYWEGLNVFMQTRIASRLYALAMTHKARADSFILCFVDSTFEENSARYKIERLPLKEDGSKAEEKPKTVKHTETLIAVKMADDICRYVTAENNPVGLEYEKSYYVGQLFDMVRDSKLSEAINTYGAYWVGLGNSMKVTVGERLGVLVLRGKSKTEFANLVLAQAAPEVGNDKYKLLNLAAESKGEEETDSVVCELVKLATDRANPLQVFYGVSYSLEHLYSFMAAYNTLDVSDNRSLRRPWSDLPAKVRAVFAKTFQQEIEKIKPSVGFEIINMSGFKYAVVSAGQEAEEELAVKRRESIVDELVALMLDASNPLEFEHASFHTVESIFDAAVAGAFGKQLPKLRSYFTALPAFVRDEITKSLTNKVLDGKAFANNLKLVEHKGKFATIEEPEYMSVAMALVKHCLSVDAPILAGVKNHFSIPSIYDKVFPANPWGSLLHANHTEIRAYFRKAANACSGADGRTLVNVTSNSRSNFYVQLKEE